MLPELQAKIQRFYKAKENPALALFLFMQEIEEIVTKKAEKEINDFKLKAQKELENERENFRKEIELFKRTFAKGDKGDVPIKGKDYFTKEEIAEFTRKVSSLVRVPQDGMTPVAGVDYLTKKQIEREIRQLVSAIEIAETKDGRTPIKGVDYFTNKDIKEILSKLDINAKIIRNKLESLKGEERINALAIKNLPEVVSKEARGIVSAAVPGYVARIARRAVSFQWIEPDGECNGVNTLFTLPYPPYNPNTLMFFVNGILQKKDSDYTIDGKEITTTTAPPTGSTVWALFRK